MVNVCAICGLRQCSETTKQGITFHRIPSAKLNSKLRAQWLKNLKLEEQEVKKSTRVCTKHFRDGYPHLTIGEKLDEHLDPTKRRVLVRNIAIAREDTNEEASVSATVEVDQPCTSSCIKCGELQDEIKLLKQQIEHHRRFGIHHLQKNDSLVTFYTGFPSYKVFQACFEFLGPCVYQLTYWGTDDTTRVRTSTPTQCKLSVEDQLLLTLMRLRLNLEERDLAVRFGISQQTVSRYFITWVSLMYKHFCEIDWWPSTEQVHLMAPAAFKAKYPITFVIIDATEIFIETPNDLFLQSSTWSSYKSHNTCKFLVGCTPNGCICFISQAYVGSISDIELTKVSGFLEKIAQCPGSAVMADRGFTIRDLLKDLNVELNIPPFMDEHSNQMDPSKVDEGRAIASLRIHVERAINRIKSFQILRGVFRLSSVRLLNQIITVCAYLTNFQPVLVPPCIPQSVFNNPAAVFMQVNNED